MFLQPVFALSLLANLVSAANPVELKRAGNTHIVWQSGGAGIKAPLEGITYAQDHDKWFLENETAFVYLGGPGVKIGWRLAEDHSNAGVLQFANISESNPIFGASYSGAPSNAPIQENFGDIGAMQFTKSKSNNSDGGIWTSTDLKPLNWTFGIEVDWSCGPDEIVYIQAVDGNNVTTNYHHINNLNIPLPETPPLTVTAWRNSTPDDITTVNFYPNSYLTGTTASGPVEPTFPAPNIFVSLFWCEDD